MNNDGMKLFIDQAIGFLGDLNNVVNEIDEIKKVSVLKSDSEKEIKTVYKQFDAIVEGLNKQSKKVGEKIEKLETMLIGIINESNKRTRTAQEKLKEELKADITAFGPILKEIKDMIGLVERDIKREYEELEEKVSMKLEKTDLDAINKKLKKKLIDDENISYKTAYSSKKTIEKIDSMINNLRLGGRGKLFILNEGSDLGQATAINFIGSAVNVTVENGVHTVDVTGGGGSGDVVGPASATDGNIALYDGATGKLIKNSTYSPTSFAPALTSDENYVTDADITKLGNITVTQAVDLDTMEADIAALANGMVYKGNRDASAGTFPGAGVAQTGRFYTVSVGGTVNAVVFNVGDRLIATVNNASTTTFAGNWTQLDATDAVTSVNGMTGNVTGLVQYTGNTADLDMSTYDVITDTLRASTSAGLLIESANGTDVGLLGAGNTANIAWYGNHNYSTATQDTIAIFTGAGKTLGSAALATYPSLTELAYVKGVTSAIQTQLNAKLGLSGGTVTGAIVLDENSSLQLDGVLSADGKWSGTTITATAGYTQAFGDLVYLDPTDSRWEAVDISVAAGANGDARGLLGMVVSAGTDGTACTILLQGTIRADANFPTLTIGAPVYASTTGDVVVSQPTTTDYVIRIIGYGLTADSLYFNPGNSWITHT